ncbi:mannose-6-phosphate isomerase [Oscillochloris trichoides DG-6]|uniref:Phosphohexomutase n=1 Tax=Oscillochloris trichoides DG-6 TaxID=765420 RepID=E1IIN7_9CHLR|nr:type I phosphomannose isomerase catalytic subunit [Oscillochloris trichoides]EFO78943.1 mannose-6-phosphate isomerase [Oscillochloris trichoides DG-6]
MGLRPKAPLMNTTLYPLLTTPQIVSPIWGGTRLAPWLDLPPPHPDQIGEIWLIYDQNRVTNGPLAGQSLAELARSYGTTLVGERSFARYGADFPLLAKFIDSAARLSIQVHPDDAYAHRHEAASGFHGKTEAWYILDAAPGADITYGMRQTCDRETFASAVHTGTLEDLLERVPVTPGDMILVPAGTIHAINAGLLIFEIQERSDLTYRVYDYNRRDAKTGQLRELHLDKALDVCTFGPARHAKLPHLNLAPGRDLLVACPYFALERWQLAGHANLEYQGSFEILTMIEGACSLIWAHGELPLRHGDAVVIPDSLKHCSLVGNATLMRVYVPDLTSLMATLRRAGHSEAHLSTTIPTL